MNIQQMMKQAQQMQSKMAEMQEKLAAMEVTGRSGGGMVETTMTGKGEVKRIKIDRSFIRDSASIPGSLPFIRTIVTLARSLGMETVAEGVESQSQLDAVISAGCDRFQGYLLAHPLPADRAELQLAQLSREECAA